VVFLSRVVSRHQNERLSYDALNRRSNSLARGLLKIGVRKGDRVAVSLGNNIEHATVGTLGSNNLD
jgi:non-ribosomal peptide synthetase component E (peptide arylation enzyme)